jgi:hypothetical protein
MLDLSQSPIYLDIIQVPEASIIILTYQLQLHFTNIRTLTGNQILTSLINNLNSFIMKTFSIASLAIFCSIASALPTPRPQTEVLESCNVSTAQFYLITASSPLCSENSSNIPMAAATSLFAPLRQANLFLRTIEPGYLSLPIFTLSQGSLYTYTTDAVGQGNYSYSTPVPADGAELQFLRDQQGDAGLTLTGGFLLGVNGVTDGWKLCEGSFGQQVAS